MSESKSSSDGIGYLGALGLIFVVLKLVGVIHWSWWWVTLPFWGGLALLLTIGLIALAVWLTVKAVRKLRRAI